MNICKTVLIILLFADLCSAQNDKWINYSYGGRTNSMALEGDYIWAGTDGGLVRINKKTDELVVYNHANSILPSNTISSLVIDSNGVKWIGTEYGLLKFDNEHWQLFDTLNSGLPNNRINALEIDGDNHLWIGTDNGAAVFKGTEFIVYNMSNSDLPGNGISEIETAGNSVWIATKPYYIDYTLYPSSITKLESNTWTVYLSGKDSVPDFYLISAMKFTGGSLWASSGPLFKFDGTKWESFNDNINSPYLGGPMAIESDKSGNLWMAYIWGGLVKYDGQNFTSYVPSNSDIHSDQLYYVAIDSSGIIYGGGHNGTVDAFDGSNWKGYAAHSWHLLSNRILALAVDTNNSVWIGTDYGGLSKIGPQGHTIYNTGNSQVPENTITALGVDSSNYVWAGTASRKAGRFDGVIWVDSFASVLPGHRIRMVSVDRKNNVWISCAEEYPYSKGGLVKINESRTELIYLSKLIGYFSDEVSSVKYDLNDILWIGASHYPEGLVSYNGSEWKSFRNTGFHSNSVTAIEIDNQNRKWIGTPADGIAVYDDYVWDYHLLEKQVRALTKDLNGNIWAALNIGAAVYDGHGWTIYDRSNSGLPENRVTSIAADKNNNIWIGTENSGVAVFLNNPVSTGISGKDPSAEPKDFVLHQNYPNPFNPSTRISYSVADIGNVVIKVFDLLGREVNTLVDEEKPAGSYSVDFDASDLASGVYYYQLSTGKFHDTKKMLLIR